MIGMTYYREVMADTPTAYWRFDEVAGITFVDQMSNAYPLTMSPSSGGVWTGGTLGTAGAVSDNYAATFTGVGFAVSASAVIPSGDFTLEAWIRSDTSASGLRDVIAQYTSGQAGRVALNVVNGFLVAYFGGIPILTHQTQLGAVWRHVAMTRAGSTVTLYVDGVPSSTTASNSVAIYSNLTRVGSYGLGEFWIGGIDEVAIYPTALSAARIAAHYAAASVALRTGVRGNVAVRGNVFAGLDYAEDYFARIYAAGSSITEANKVAVRNFIAGCKADGIWTAIKACCLLAGPDSLAGALVPLVGVAPTNVGLTGAQYSRTSGVSGNASQYINTNRTCESDPLTNKHVSLYFTTPPNIGAGWTTSFGGTIGNTVFSAYLNSGTYYYRLGVNGYDIKPLAVNPTGFIGVSRTNTTVTSLRYNGINNSSTATATQGTGSQMLFRGSDGWPSASTISFYSIGESLNLALLDARLATYMAALT